MEGFHNVCFDKTVAVHATLPAGIDHTIFSSHDGLTRGISHLRSCETGEIDCKNKNPHLLHYDGYKSFSEPVSQIVSCIGPRGIQLNESHDDAIWAYPGHANGKIDLNRYGRVL